MNTISNKIKTKQNSVLVDSINYLGQLLLELDLVLYSKFVNERFIDDMSLEELYIKLLDILKTVRFN